MNKIIAILLALCLCVCVCACEGGNGHSNGNDSENTLTANPKDNELLPFGLEFGMSNEEAKGVHQDFPIVSYADYESFYNIDGQELYADMMEGDGIVLDPNCNFDFNDEQKLYAFTVKTTIYDGEGAAEFLFNEYVDFFQDRTGLTATINETPSKLEARIETETLHLSVILEEKEGDFTVSAITCCKVYE